jgi:hypothetical protein
MGATLQVTGGDDVRRMLGKYEGREYHNRLRRAVRAGAKPFQQGLKDAAAAEPTGNLPDTFRKVPAAKVSASARRGGDIVARVRPKSPLFNIFEPGADAHDIAPTKGVLSNFEQRRQWADQASGGPFFARRKVRHPGMKARPIMPIAFAARKRQAEHEIARVLFEQAI